MFISYPDYEDRSVTYINSRIVDNNEIYGLD